MQTTKAIIISTTSALIMGILLHLMLPAVLGVLLAGGASGATLLDPLYAGDRIEAIWEVFGAFLTVQTAQAFILAPLSGALIGYIATKIKSGWIYVLAPIVGLLVHSFLFILILVLAGVFTIEGIGLVLSTSIFLSLAIAPIIGLVSALLIKLFVRESK